MVTLIKNIFIILVIVVLVYAVTVYSTPLRGSIMSTKEAVAGVSTSDELLSQSLPGELQEDINIKVENVKEQVLGINVGEIFSFFGRAAKIIEDIHVLQDEVKEKVKESTN